MRSVFVCVAALAFGLAHASQLTAEANDDAQPPPVSTPKTVVEPQPGDGFHTAIQRRIIALEAARLEQVNLGQHARTARRVLTEEGTLYKRAEDDLTHDGIVPRLIDRDPIYQLWLSRATPETSEFGYRQGPTEPKVSFGFVMGAAKYPEVVALLTSSGESVCTGALLGRDTVVTAAHCFCGAPVEQVVFGASTTDPVKTISITGRPVVPNDVNLVSDGYTSSACERSTFGNDVAVVKLSETVGARVSRRTVRFGQSEHVAQARAGTTLYVVGFGRTETGKKGTKMRATMPIINPTCRPSDAVSGADQTGCVADREFVSQLLDRTPAKPAAGPCIGDSGGPAFIKIGSRQYLVGVVSRGGKRLDQTNKYCGELGIYTRLTAETRTFIRSSCELLGGKKCP